LQPKRGYIGIIKYTSSKMFSSDVAEDERRRQEMKKIAVLI
jgi:hypothetical protein